MAGRSDNKVIISILGVDLTKGTFAKVGRAVARFGAVAAGVGVAGAAAIGKAARELSVLSDRAAQANTSADSLQRLSTAMGVLGVKGADIESLTTAMAYMARTTGRSGIGGLKETLAEISAIGDEGARVDALMKSFGRGGGAGFAALVRQGPEAVRESFDAILAAMPALSSELADAGDGIADGMTIAMQGVKNAWQELLMQFATGITGTDMSFRELGARIAAWATYIGRTILDRITAVWDRIKLSFRYVGELAMHPFSFDEVTAKYGDLFAEVDARLEQALAPAKAELDESLSAASKLDEAIANLTGGAKKSALSEALGGAGASMRTGAGSLVQANSYAALRTTVFSPLRTMTGYLADIVRNTSATTDALETLPATA